MFFFISVILFLYVRQINQPNTIPQSALIPVISVSPTPRELYAEKLWEIVNDYRLSKNLQSFEKNSELCDIADLRSKEAVFDKSDHEGFIRKYKNYPHKISENLILYPTSEEEVFLSWISSPAHKTAIEGSWKYSCISCDGSSACSQIFSSFDNVDHNKL